MKGSKFPSPGVYIGYNKERRPYTYLVCVDRRGKNSWYAVDHSDPLVHTHTQRDFPEGYTFLPITDALVKVANEIS